MQRNYFYFGYVKGIPRLTPNLPVRSDALSRDSSSLGLTIGPTIEWMGIRLTPVRIQSHTYSQSVQAKAQV